MKIRQTYDRGEPTGLQTVEPIRGLYFRALVNIPREGQVPANIKQPIKRASKAPETKQTTLDT
jgi:hypothetical protein